MNIGKDCIGCGSCVACCPMEAISLGPDGAKINQDECVECNACIRAEVCPTDSLIKPKLTWPRTIRRAFSDPGPQHATGVPGRGTEEMKTNDVTGRYRRGDVGFVLDVGRPGVGTRLRTVEKIYKMLIGLGVHFEEQNPLRGLLKEDDRTSFKEEVLDEKVLSIIIEFIVPNSGMKEILEALRSCAAEIDTVFSVGLVDRVLEDGSMENAKLAGELGYPISVNAKVNVGLGRPLAKS